MNDLDHLDGDYYYNLYRLHQKTNRQLAEERLRRKPSNGGLLHLLASVLKVKRPQLPRPTPLRRGRTIS